MRVLISSIVDGSKLFSTEGIELGWKNLADADESTAW